MSIFTPENVAVPASVFHIDDKATRIEFVLSADTESAELTCAHQPSRVDPATNEIATFKLKFDAIHPIYGGKKRPGLFHCYGTRREVA